LAKRRVSITLLACSLWANVVVAMKKARSVKIVFLICFAVLLVSADKDKQLF
jgi:hypothetical protein